MDALQAKATLNAVSAVPQLEQADKLLTRLPQAKWAADMYNSSRKNCPFQSYAHATTLDPCLPLNANAAADVQASTNKTCCFQFC